MDVLNKDEGYLTPLVAFTVFDTEAGSLVLKHGFTTNNKGALLLRSGKAVDGNDLVKAVSNAVSPSGDEGSFISENLIFKGFDRVAWLCPASTHTLRLNVGGRKSFFNVPLPQLLFVRRKNFLSVQALKDNGRPQLTDRMLHAPVMNTGVQGGVCLGSVRLDGIDINDTQKTENVFFDSWFSHTNSQNIFKDKPSSTDDLVRLYKAMHNKDDDFDTNTLAESGLTVEEFVRGVR